MGTLDKLLHVAKLELDRRRHQIGELHAMRSDLEARSVDIDRRIEAERQASLDDPLVGASVGTFINAGKQQQQVLQASMAEVDEQIEAMRDVVAEAFREMKRYEQLIDRKAQEARRRRDRREQLQMDEIGLRRSNF